MSYYPKEVFHPNIEVTKENMRQYDKCLLRLEEEILKKYPNYHEMNLRDRMIIRKEVQATMKW